MVPRPRKEQPNSTEMLLGTRVEAFALLPSPKIALVVTQRLDNVEIHATVPPCISTYYLFLDSRELPRLAFPCFHLHQ